MKTIGVVGMGFVGSAVIEGMRHACAVETYDIDDSKPRTCSTLYDLGAKCDVVFVCVPTPMRRSGQCSTDLVRDIVMRLERVAKTRSSHTTVAIKSTVEPGTTARLQEMCEARAQQLDDVFRDEPWADVVFNPEFLTEANHIDDFKHQDRIIIGGKQRGTNELCRLYEWAYPRVPQRHLTSTEAELVKYTTNVFLATKVSLANELHQICSALDVDYDRMIEAAKLDGRLGESYWQVPGHQVSSDGSGRHLKGWGLSCWPKDLNGLMHMARELGIDPKVMKAVWDKNLELRPPEDRDWERMPRATTSDFRDD